MNQQFKIFTKYGYVLKNDKLNKNWQIIVVIEVSKKIQDIDDSVGIAQFQDISDFHCLKWSPLIVNF
jgi:hypothetical protein